MHAKFFEGFAIDLELGFDGAIEGEVIVIHHIFVHG